MHFAAKFREIVFYFLVDLTALQTAELSGLNRNTINRIYRGLRERIVDACEAQRPMLGVVEVDESLFVAKRVNRIRETCAYGRTTSVSRFECDGQVYTTIVRNSPKASLQDII